MLRVAIVMIASALAAAGGQVLIRRGMQQIGGFELGEHLTLLPYVGSTVVNPHVLGGTLLQLVAFLLVIMGLSWKDVTVVMPFAALEHLFVAVLAIVILQEAISLTRWAGIVLVVVGVVLVTYSGAEGERGNDRTAGRPVAGATSDSS
jgi:drug/metabolite transporter (DMT)-like permease